MKILYCEQDYSSPGDCPHVSLLTDSSMSRNHQPLFLPQHHTMGWNLTIAPAVRISRLGKYVAPKFASRYYDAITLVARLRPNGVSYPASAIDTAFDSSIVVGEWHALQAPGDIPMVIMNGKPEPIELPLNHQLLDNTVAWLSQYFMIKHGDIIVPGDINSSIKVEIDQTVDLRLNNLPCIDFKIK